MMIIKRLLKYIFITIATLAFAVIAINYKVKTEAKADLQYSINTQEKEISDISKAKLIQEKADCIMVLGAGIIDRNTPSPILKDRLDAGIALYKAGVAPKLLLTGDNGSNEHNEIHVMLHYCLSQGIPAADIFCDHAGFSTSESMVRAKEIFGVKKTIIVTQQYHEYRAMYIAKSIGMQVVGVSADQNKFSGQGYREFREVFARNKDFIKCLFNKNKATGGEKISINGDGRISHGE